MSDTRLAFLEVAAVNYDKAQRKAGELRDIRDKLALECIDKGYTWREVAERAHFKNPYIAHLKRRQAKAVSEETGS